MQRMIRHYQAFSRAKQLLALGYPLTHIAEELGVHRNTVLAWSRKLGFSASSGDKAKSQRLSSIMRKVQRLSLRDREALFRLLDRRGLTARKV